MSLLSKTVILAGSLLMFAGALFVVADLAPTTDTLKPEVLKMSPAVDCTPPNCKTPAPAYTPAFMPALYDYTEGYGCDPLHPNPGLPAATVRLARNERLEDALLRLKQKSPQGGVLEVEGDTIQCDSLRFDSKIDLPRLTIRGVGKMARAYCRMADFERLDSGGAVRHVVRLGGTIPKDKVEPTFLRLGAFTGEFVLENFEIDGFKRAVEMGRAGTFRFLNVYAHSGLGSGFGNLNTGGPNGDPYRNIERPSRFEASFCGVEVSHYGQSNHTHNFYMHASLGGGGGRPELLALGPDVYDTWSRVNVVDSFIHSARWSSNFKSIANENNVVNSRIWSTLTGTGVDDGLPVDNSQAEIDITLAADILVTGSDIRKYKPDRRTGGSAVISLRARMTALRGSHVPLMWRPYRTRAKDPATGKSYPTPPSAKNIRHPAHSPQWWDELGGKKHFITRIKDTRISFSGVATDRLSALEVYHTHWLWDGGTGYSPCLLPMPPNAYERAHVYLENVDYVGFGPEQRVSLRGLVHSKNCREPRPPGPTLESWRRFGVVDVIE